MPATIGIIGGGVGGTLVANRIARRLGDAAEVTVFDADGTHVYQPAWLYVPFGKSDPDAAERPERSLLRREVNLRVASVERFDPAAREVVTEDGVQRFDFLVAATGCRPTAGSVEGLPIDGTATDCWTREGSERLRERLRAFDGGRIVTGAVELPIKCPPAPLEFTFMLDELLRRRVVRDRWEIHYVFPLERIYKAPKVAEKITPLLDERGIRHHHPFTGQRVDLDGGVLESREGQELPFDVLAVAPPHRGAEIVERSGAGDESGWIPVDAHTLESVEHPGFFAVGDAAALSAPKSGAAAHFGGLVAADRIAEEVRGRTPEATYDGRVACFMETGYGEATILTFDYEKPLDPPLPSKRWHLLKGLMNRAYFETLPRGFV